MSAHSGPNIVEDGLVLYLDAANEKSFKPYNNLLDPWLPNWIEGSGSVTGFGANGSSTENYRIFDTDPWGNPNLVWEARPDATSGADGGWGSSYIDIDQSKMYRFSVWVRRTVKGNGHFYFGTYGINSSNSNIGVKYRVNTNTTTNPYFEVNAAWNEWPGHTDGGNEWFLVVAHVWPYGSGEGSNHADSGIYKQDGTLVDIIEYDFTWLDGTAKAGHRTYLYYSTDINTRQQWIYPRVDIVDGNEPSIQELLDGSPNTFYDISGNSNNGKILGGINFNSASKVLSSNGLIGSYIDVPSPNLSSSDFTIIAATRYASSSPRGRIVSAKSNNWLMGHWGGNVNRFYSNGWVSTPSGADEEWRVFVGTGNISSDQYSFWSNLDTLVSSSAGGSAGPNGFSLGRYALGNSEYSNCDISFLAAYNRVLSDEEIKKSVNALRSRFGI